jgi:hypothetical protein
MCYEVQIPHSEDDDRIKRVSVTVSKVPAPKVTMDLKDKQRAVIEFPLLEGCTGEEIVMRLRSVYVLVTYYHVSVFRWIDEVRRGSEELRNE